MPGKNQTYSRKAQSRGGNVLPALCNIIGTLMIVAVIALCLPLTVPMVAGYQVYEVVSGSMEPAIPVGSAVYVKQVEPSEIKVGDVVAYQDESGVVVHRVTINRTGIGELVTKGDANNVEDFSPIPYNAVLGREEMHIPFMGSFMALYASVAGKVYLFLIVACGVMLNLVASALRQRRREKADDTLYTVGVQSSAPGESGSSALSSEALQQRIEQKAASKRSCGGNIVLRVVVIVLLIVFLGSGGVIAYVNWQYGVSDSLYNQAFEDYTDKQNVLGKAPISVDFDKLRAKNPDVVGWLYCEGTRINYPVVQGKDNDFYLSHDYTGDFNINGSIFVDAGDKLAVDSKAVIYGHHMQSGSMFASLLDWSSQEFYDKHKTMWLLTPTQTYEVQLFSGHHANAYSNMYVPVHEPGDALNAYLANAKSLSDFQSDVKLDPNGRYIMLSTCAYLFDDDRYLLHGMLVPVSS